MSDPTNSPDIPSVIFSLASAAGPTPWTLPDSRVIDPCGLAAALASLSASQVRALGLRTSGISGRRGSTSSASAALRSSLESRLRQRLTGSTSCLVTWKPWTTPWTEGQLKPRAQARIISGIAIGLWPTMTSNAPARNGNSESGNSAGQVAIRKAMIGLWPTCIASEARQGFQDRSRGMKGSQESLTTVVLKLALWPTARASDGAKGGPSMTFGAGGLPLPSSAWRVANTSSAPTENSRSGVGSLHPEFAGWELGYPPEWLSCAPLETRSTRGQPAPSSKATAKPGASSKH